MRGHTTYLAGLAFAALFTGCAAERSEFVALREQVRLQQKQIVDLKATQEEHQTKIEILDNGFRILGDNVEENARRIDDVQGASLGAPATPDVRIPAAPAPLPVAPAPPPAAAAPAPAPPTPPPPEPLVVQPKMKASELYRSALDHFSKENYQEAILQFEEFIANHPSHDLADNAQYWIGECYYARKNFEQAVIVFEKVERYYGSGNKAGAALLKKGLALKELGKDAEAVVALEKLVTLYPNSDESTIAQKKLSLWR